MKKLSIALSLVLIVSTLAWGQYVMASYCYASGGPGSQNSQGGGTAASIQSGYIGDVAADCIGQCSNGNYPGIGETISWGCMWWQSGYTAAYAITGNPSISSQGWLIGAPYDEDNYGVFYCTWSNAVFQGYIGGKC